MDTAPLAITSLQPFKRMALETAMVAAAQGTGNLRACEVTHQRFASGPGPFDVFRIGS